MRLKLPHTGLKRWLPRSLFGRTLLIIVLPVAIMQIAVTWVFFEAHWRTVTNKLSAGLAGDVAWLTSDFERAPSGLEALTAQSERTLSLSVAFRPGDALPARRRPSFFAALDQSLDAELAKRLDRPFWFDTTRYPAYVDIRVQAKGGVLRIIAPRDRAFATRGHIFVFWLGLTTVLLTAVAVAFIRNQIRAIERLAHAADAFGRGADPPMFKPEGAREVRLAAQAFLAMRARIQRFIDQRTGMLASVSHDLRTPMTRLQLELALIEPGPRVDSMRADLREMEHMIDEYLEFARAEAGEAGEAGETVEITEFADHLMAAALKSGADIEAGQIDRGAVELRPQAVRRAVENLIMNAMVHGDRIRLSAALTPTGGVEFIVEDDGPGIAPDRYEDAFKPFGRLDPSRNQNRKGVGLGLAIARDIARAHGGELTLSRSPLGGLKATVRLPG